MKREVFNEDVNENITDVPDLQTDFNDYVNEEELLALEQEQQMIDMMEERALLEQAEEQAVIDAYIEQQLIEQSLLNQTDEEARIESEDQQHEPTITVPKEKRLKQSLNDKESRKIVKEFLNKHSEFFLMEEKIIFPYEYQTDGVYYAKMIKKSEEDL